MSRVNVAADPAPHADELLGLVAIHLRPDPIEDAQRLAQLPRLQRLAEAVDLLEERLAQSFEHLTREGLRTERRTPSASVHLAHGFTDRPKHAPRGRRKHVTGGAEF